MTETATVTDYSVGEMWQKLDDYTNIANKLGATTLGTYKTITLFFQQGLDEQQSLALATETMKMARVAGIDYAEATQYMTSALRGFNMELNETSATRVNDVYSELAKITAADTNQIAVAMSKVASLANSANMELETTSAFLSQIIETTQEAPETAGTALKTIIARFSEVKKLFSEGDLTGSDENGDVIDVNKIGAALRNVGIDLNQYIAGNVGLDEIFLQLAEKWDSLSLVQQRYIATQAAGSRQQSRFIAMMQNYARTMELVDAAYNSAGSGQDQFEKTLESLEAKLNNLHNAWDSFSMSIADSNVIKGAVDLFTQLLTIVNNLSDAFGKFSGVAKLMIGFGLFKGGNTLLTGGGNPLNTFLGTLKESKDIFRSFNAASQPFKENIRSIGTTLQESLGIKELSTAAINERIQNITAEIRNTETLMKMDPSNVSVYTTELQRLNTELYTTQKQLERSQPLHQFSSQLTAVGSAALLAGQGLKALGNSIGDEDLAKFGQSVSIFGAIAASIGQLIVVLPKLAEAFNLTLSISAPQIAALLALVGAITAVTVAIKNQIKHEQDLYTQSDKTLDKITELTSGVEELTSMKDSLDSLTEGSVDWYVQLGKIKKKIEEIIALDPDMAKFLRYDEEEGYIFDKQGYEQHKAEQVAFKQGQDRAEKAEQGIDQGLSSSTTISWVKGKGLQATRNDRFDLPILRQNYGIGSDQIDDNTLLTQLNSLLEKINNTNIEDQRSYIASQTGLTDFTDKEANKYYLSLLVDELLSQLAESLKAEEPLQGWTDKIGQNTYNDYADQGSKVLGEQLDYELITHEYADALYKYWETLEKFPETIKKDQNAMKGLALDTGAAIKKFQALADVMNDTKEDTKDILKSGQKNSVEYQMALGKVITAAQKAYGESLSPDYVRDNIDKFISAFIDGNNEAAKQIQQDLIKNFNVGDFLKEAGYDDIQIDPTAFDTIRQQILELTQSQEFKLNGVADFTSVYEAFRQLGITSIEVMNAIVQAMALEAHFAVDENGNMKLNVSSPGLLAANGVKAGVGSKKSGGSSKQKEKAWENPYDQLYNLTERNEEAIRKRNILEKEYNAILRDRESAANELTKNSLQQLANLQEQLAYQKQLQAGRLKQINAVNNETWTDSEGNRKSYAAWDVTQYASYNQKTNAIEIDWDAIDKVTDETKGKAIEDYIKRLEELQKEFEKTDEDILDIEAEIDEINRRSKDDFLSLEQRVYDAIVKQHQEVIDAYSSFNDTLNDTNDKIMNGLREQIDLERQIRDNTKTEEDIAEKEARLAYLQRDTSGANATETLRLQKEIDDARQSYSDSLIDQQIDSIEKGNEKAAEQRQIQISMMQEQLDYWTKNGAFWSTVSSLLTNAIDPETGKLDKNNAALVSLLMDAENFGGLSEFGQMDWYDDLVEAFNKGMEGFGNFKMQQAEEAGEITQGGNTYKYDKSKKAWMLGGEAYSAVYDPVTGQYIFTRNKTEDVKTGTIGESKEEIKAETSKDTNSKYTGSTTHKYTVSLGSWTQEIDATDEAAARKKAGMYYDTYGIWYAKQRSNYSLDDFKKQFTKDQFMNYLTIAQKYASGGFADYTGPAWLDGTKTKPEAVLNAKQTELFISLRDMLEKFGQTGGFTNSYGNTYVDLDVNADIGSDYDVDSLVNRLKRDILDSSSYRNVNMLSRGH